MSNHIKVTGAPAISINLSQHSDKFRADSQTFLLNKSVNFVYGKNGTGKTTIVDEVSKQFSSSYDVCIFKDFEGVVENERLNAVSLGTTNATVQKQIDIIDAEISEINKQIRPPEGEDTKNLFMIAAEQKNNYEVQERKINSFYTNSAREIKNLSNPQIAKTSYDKVSFREDIANALLLSEDGIKKYRSIIRTVHKSHPRVITFPSMDLSVYLKSVNDIISSNLTQPCDIPELTNNAEKHNFARQGYNIHEHKLGETCAFCGNGISEERWNLLAMYFNDEIKSIEKQIDSMYKQIENEIIKARNITQIEEADFYDNFKADVDQLNVLILTKQSEYIKSLSDLQNGLIKKKENLFIRFSELEIEMPESYEKIRLEYGNLIEKNNNFAQNLVNEQNQARDALRYHQVKSMLDAWSFDDESNNLEVLRQLNEQAQLAPCYNFGQ